MALQYVEYEPPLRPPRADANIAKLMARLEEELGSALLEYAEENADYLTMAPVESNSLAICGINGTKDPDMNTASMG